MNVKKVLKFYFGADRAEGLLDRLILKKAYSADCTRGAQQCAEEVAKLVQAKCEMCRFYGFIDRVLARLNERERGVLEKYATRSAASLAPEECREAHRLSVAFARRIKGCSEKFAAGLRIALCYSFQA